MRNMSQLTSAVAVGKELPVNVAIPEPKKSLQARHVLEFEKPLARFEQQIQELEALQAAKGSITPRNCDSFAATTRRCCARPMTILAAWETVQVARHPQRPLFKDYVEMICREFREFHGDRHFGDDPAIKCGLAQSRRPQGHAHRPSQRPRHQGKGPVLLRIRASRRLPQSPALHEIGREIRHSGGHTDRYAGRLSRHRNEERGQAESIAAT